MDNVLQINSANIISILLILSLWYLFAVGIKLVFGGGTSNG